MTRIVVRLYPTREQEKIINQTFGCVRLIYNTLLDYAKENKEYHCMPLSRLDAEQPVIKDGRIKRHGGS